MDPHSEIERIASGAHDPVSTPNEQAVKFKRTILVQDRLRGKRFFEEATPENRNGIWQGRRIIGRDSPINNGVYLGGGPREAIVVDDEKQPELNNLYRQLIRNIEKDGSDYKNNALREVFELVKKTLRYDEKGVDQIHQRYGVVPDQKIGLDVYTTDGVGVCRHQALLCGYLLERLVAERHLSGTVSVDRNQVEGLGGHAWVRYINSRGEVIILDVAQDYLGFLGDISQDQFRWFYERPKDSKHR